MVLERVLEPGNLDLEAPGQEITGCNKKLNRRMDGSGEGAGTWKSGLGGARPGNHRWQEEVE